MTDSRRCYVLGAGFSRAFGLPLARELTYLAFSGAYPSDDGPGVTARNLYQHYIKHFFPKYRLDYDRPDTWPDFEELITVIDEDEDYRLAYTDAAGADEPGLSPDHLRRVLLRKMALDLCEKGLAVSTEDMALISRFLQHVRDGRHAVVSFNWDLLIENAAHELGLAIARGGDNSNGLHLAKPHGSIDLAEMLESEYRERKASVFNLFDLVETQLPDHRILLRAENPADVANRIIHPFAFKELLIVPPNLRKTYTSSWIKSEWRRAMDMVRDADEIFVIGYSLPHADLRPRVLLCSGSTADQRIRPITIVAPNADELVDHYRNYVACDVHPIKGSWIDWFDSEE